VYTGKKLQSARPVVRTRSNMRLLRPRRRWNQISWWYSLVFVIPVLLIAGDVLFGLAPDRDESRVTISVTDSTSGDAVQGATVALGGDVQVTDFDGSATFSPPTSLTVIQVVASGYQPVYASYGNSNGPRQSVALRRLTVAAAATPSESQAESLSSDQEQVQVATAEPTSTVAPDTANATAQSESGVVATGTILDADGKPIADALVAAGGEFTRSRKNGKFSLKNADVSGGLIVNAPGYTRQVVPAGTDITVFLERLDIKAVYLNGNRAGDEAFVDGLIDLINRTELDAVVIDIKEHTVFYDTQVKFFRDAEAVQPTYDPAEVVRKFKEAGIYTIARQVVFKDPLVAEAYPELAVKDEETGGLWRGWQGEAWVNPFKKDLWQPNIDLALEAIGFGFDEIQYDYIRFPSDGDLTTADFGPDYDEEGRVGAIVDFLKLTRKEIAPTGAMLAVDIFGIVTIYPDDQGIGQRLVDIAPVVDYVCPMIYPSHFDATSIDVGGEPNAHPYDTISLAVSLSLEKMTGMELKLRPWLQDFTLGEPEYGPDEVRAQIDATEELSSNGWLLWNAASEVTEDALEPQ
jgi:hypothetical protein